MEKSPVAVIEVKSIASLVFSLLNVTVSVSLVVSTAIAPKSRLAGVTL
jgi:hypothetical protein